MDMRADNKDLMESIRHEIAVSSPHYYGDVVRRLFIAAGVIVLLTFPFFGHRLPTSIAIASVFAFGLGAGLTSPIRPWTIVLDTFIAITTLGIFEYYTIMNYQGPTASFLFLLINQVTALLAFLALYYSLKTVRAYFMKRA